jgi:hypothetical protein
MLGRRKHKEETKRKGMMVHSDGELAENFNLH